MALSWDDERYEELPDWDKDAYWHVWIGDQHVRFPKPFFCLAVIVK
ncbi:LPD38 domain-containing protein [Pectobacterium carotovorum]|nr:LPD38 domain-containing protein [Pectobacterium carotovorum]